MILNKKNVLIISLVFASVNCFSVSLYDLSELTLQSNIDILEADTAYKEQLISTKSLDGYYVPSLSVNATANIADKHDWSYVPDYLSSSLSYSQTLPGGASFSIELNYNFNAITFNNNRYMAQSPYISFNLSQSLFPFWLQGKKNDPVYQSFRQNEECYYYKFLYTKKDVLTQLFQNYISALTSLNEMAMNKNSIDFYEEQIESLKELKSGGNTSLAEILEVENQKWNAQQNYMVAYSNYAMYVKILKSICNKDFNESELKDITDKDIESLVELVSYNQIDPLQKIYNLKIQMIQSSRVLEKQSTAPVLVVSVKPSWNLKTTTQNEWITAWDKNMDPSNTVMSLGIDFTPMFNGLFKQKGKKYKLEKNQTEESYKAYMMQKDIIKSQYEIILANYTRQKEIITSLYESGLNELKDYEKQFKAGAISKLDYDSVRIRVQNCGYSKDNVDLYVKLYAFLIKIQ